MTSCWEIKVVTCSFLLVLLIFNNGWWKSQQTIHDFTHMNGHTLHPPFESSASQSQLCALWLCCAYWAVLSIWCSLTLRPLLSLNFPAAIMYINLWRKCATHLGRSVFNFRRRIEREVSRFSMRSIPQLVTTGHRTFLCAGTRSQSCARNGDLCSPLHINHRPCKMKTCGGKRSITCGSSQVKGAEKFVVLLNSCI